MIGAFVGVVLGGGGVALGWFATTADHFTSSPGQLDASAACAVVTRTASLDPATEYSGLLRWSAASIMAKAAAETDPQYKALHQAIDRPIEIFSDQFTTAGPEFADAVAKARQACSD